MHVTSETSYGRSKERLLRAGIDLLRREPPPTALINASLVAKKAGLSRTSFYAHWSSQEEFVADLLRFVAAERIRALETVKARVAELLERGEPLRRVIAEACELGLGRIELDPMFAVQMALWPHHAVDVTSKRALAALYKDFDEAVLPIYREVLSRFQLEPRPPFTLEMIAQVVTALADGTVLRRRVDPGRERVPAPGESRVTLPEPPDLFPWTLQAMAMAMLKRIDDERDLWELWAAFVEGT
jgi:AcrR family transcriptional regulator